MTYDETHDLLWVGDRDGNLYIYDCAGNLAPSPSTRTTSDADGIATITAPAVVLPKAHGVKSVTSIVVLKDRQVCTIGRDGYYQKFEVHLDTDTGTAVCSIVNI